MQSAFCIPRRVNGFTLIELIVVLIIIATVSGLVGIYILRGSGNLELKTFTKEVSATLRYARSHAISEKKVYSFILWNDKKAYALYTDSLKDVEDEESEEARHVVYRNVPESLDISFNNSNEDIRIDFFPQGNSSGGSIEIINDKGRSLFISVNRVSGIVKVESPE